MEIRYNEFGEREIHSLGSKLKNWYLRRIFQILLAETNGDVADTSILELGSGRGDVAQLCKNLGFKKYSAIEPNASLAKATRSAYGDGCDVMESYLPAVPAGFEKQFDVVFSLHVLEHAPDPYSAHDWVKAMKAMVKPGGFIVVAGPDFRDYMHFWDSDWSHGYPLTPNRVVQIFRDQEISVVSSSSLHLGRTNGAWGVVAKFLSVCLPTRPLDAITHKLFGTPMMTGFKIPLLWGTTFVIGKSD